MMAKERLKRFFKKDLKILFPQLYFLGLIVSLVVTLLFAIYPSLTICSSIFGEEFCTPTGLFMGMIISIPGYLIVGNVLSFFPAIPLVASLFLVLVVTALLYFLAGLLIDKLLKAKRNKSTRPNKVTTYITLSFIVLVILFLGLMFITRLRGL